MYRSDSPNGQSVEVLSLLLLLFHDLLDPLLQSDAQVVDFGVVWEQLGQHDQTVTNLRRVSHVHTHSLS